MNEQSKEPRLLETSTAVIDELGGPTAIARQLNVAPNVVGNWHARGFPPETFVALTTLLTARNCYAPPALWKQHQLAS